VTLQSGKVCQFHNMFTMYFNFLTNIVYCCGIFSNTGKWRRTRSSNLAVLLWRKKSIHY